MNITHVPHKIKSLLSFGHINPLTNLRFKKNSNNLASLFASQLHSVIKLLPFICPFSVAYQFLRNFKHQAGINMSLSDINTKLHQIESDICILNKMMHDLRVSVASENKQLGTYLRLVASQQIQLEKTFGMIVDNYKKDCFE